MGSAIGSDLGNNSNIAVTATSANQTAATFVETETAATATSDNVHAVVRVQQHGTVNVDNQFPTALAVHTDMSGINGHTVAQAGVYGEAIGGASVTQSVGLSGYANSATLNIGVAGDHDGTGYAFAGRGELALFSDYNWGATPPVKITPTSAKFSGQFGVNGTSPISKPTVTGSRGSNAALASLLTALANYGLITDSTTA